MKSTFLTKRNVFYINIIIGFILVFSLIILARDILTHSFTSEKTLKKDISVTEPAPKFQQKRRLADYAPVLKNNPFGFPGGDVRPLTATKPSNSGGAQRTDIVLLGTVVGPKDVTYAILMDDLGMQEVFKLGEPVFGGGTLSSVKKDRVTIGKGPGSVEILLDDIKIKEVRGPNHARTPSSFAQQVGRDTYLVDQRNVQQAIENPTQIMTDARLRPNIVNGKEQGFMLSEVRQGGIYQSLGLRNGDILLRINEYDISNPERALQAFTALRGMDRVQVDLMRSGSRITMTYQIR